MGSGVQTQLPELMLQTLYQLNHLASQGQFIPLLAWKMSKISFVYELQKSGTR